MRSPRHTQFLARTGTSKGVEVGRPQPGTDEAQGQLQHLPGDGWLRVPQGREEDRSCQAQQPPARRVPEPCCHGQSSCKAREEKALAERVLLGRACGSGEETTWEKVGECWLQHGSGCPTPGAPKLARTPVAPRNTVPRAWAVSGGPSPHHRAAARRLLTLPSTMAALGCAR